MKDESRKIKLLLAPMATLTHQVLRNAIYKFGGCDEYYCEMIHASSLIHDGKFEKYYIMSGPEKDKMVWQLTDSISSSIIEASKIICNLGGIGIDINMGCPAPEIYKFGAGMAWMNKNLSETSKMLNSVQKVLSNSSSSCKRLSVKCRLGEEDFTEEGFFSFIDMLLDSGVTQIVLHPRTRKQKYSRSAKWYYVQKLKEYTDVNFPNQNILIIGNGDVKDKNSALNALSICPNVDGIMIARSAVQKPWIFSQIAKELDKNFVPNFDFSQKLDLLEFTKEYLDGIREFQPEEFWKTRTQRFFVYFCDNFSFAHFLKTQMLNVGNWECENGTCKAHIKQIEILTEYFNKMSEERFLQL